MCGITGFFQPQGVVAQPHLIEDMAEAIVHRGPDAQGYHRDYYAHLASLRLSIIDVDGGDQPIYTPDKRYCIVFNGEIYNYQSLRQQLIALGFTFQTQTDTEVILHGYVAWGPQVLLRLQGMFALAIWDSAKKELFLARDRMGIKPLYICELSDGGLVFGSEIKALLKHPEAPRKLYLTAIENLLTYGFNVAPHTFFEGIKQVLPGHYLLTSQQGIKDKEYWDIDMDAPVFSGSEQELAEALHEQIKRSVQARLVADVPVAAYLSGGIDSSAVVGLYSQMSDQAVKTITIAFDSADYNETPYSRQVANFFGTDNHEFLCTIEPDDITKLVYHLEDPMVTLLNLPLYLLSQTTREQGLKVVLTGDGSDEIFGGYSYFRMLKLKHFAAKTNSAFRKNLLQRLYPDVNNSVKAEMRYGYLDSISTKFPINYPAMPYQFQEFQFKKELYAPDFMAAMDECYMDDPFCFDITKIQHRSMMDQALYIETKMRLLNLTLPLSDKMSMANSVEVRPCFLDHDLVNFVFRIPDHYKMRALGEKSILKRSMRGFLPDEICERRKQPLQPPQASFLKIAQPLMDDYLSEDMLQQKGYFNPSFIQSMVAQHHDPQNKADVSGLLVVALFVQLWDEIFLKL